MPRIAPIHPATATGRARELLDQVQGRLGRAPNFNTLAQTELDLPRVALDAAR